MTVLQVMHQPVGHLVGHHLDQEGEAILLQQHRIETQPAASEVRLTGTLALQVQPYRRARQPGVQLATQPIRRLDPLEEGTVEGDSVEGVESGGVGGGKRGYRHGMIEWRLRVEA